MPALTTIAVSVGRDIDMTHWPGHPTAPIRPPPPCPNVKKWNRRNCLAAPFIREAKPVELIQRVFLQRISIHASASVGIEDYRNATPREWN